MDISTFYLPTIVILIIIALLKFAEIFIANVFSPNKKRTSDLYQGGESIKSKIRNYRAENFNLTMFFMVLHVIGFIGATIFVLQYYNIDPINWTTMTFGVIIFYISLIIRFSDGERL